MPSLGNIVIYADDPPALAAFWSDVFGYPHARFEGALRDTLLAAGLTDDDLKKRGLAEDPEGRGPRFFFHHADGPKSGRNRIHVDVNTDPAPGEERATAERVDAEKDRLVALGAEVVRRVDQHWGPWHEYYWQLRDPEGNEFCLQ
jgi:predicted enzyme related to lactoylglutathione lyase